MEEVSILNKTKSKVPSLPFLDLKNEILGQEYDLSLAFVGKKTSHQLNLTHRGKNRPTNVLSFSLTKTSGELVLCPSVIKQELKKFNRTFEKLILYLVIHGMLHLAGMEHGSIMENREKKYEENYYRHRHRNRNYTGHSSRVSKRRKYS